MQSCTPMQPGTTSGTQQSSGGGGKKEGLLRLARTSAEAGDYATAADLYRRALPSMPEDSNLRIELAKALLAQGNYREARQALEDAQKLDPQNVEALRLMAITFLHLSNPDKSVAYFDKALKLKPDDARIYAGKGAALDYAGKHEQARETYAEGLKHTPANADILTNLGMSLILSGQYDEAIATLLPVTESMSATPKARQNLALAYGLKGDKEKAYQLGLEDLEKEKVEENLKFYESLQGEAASPLPIAPAPVKE